MVLRGRGVALALTVMFAAAVYLLLAEALPVSLLPPPPSGRIWFFMAYLRAVGIGELLDVSVHELT